MNLLELESFGLYSKSKIKTALKRVLFSQLKIGNIYYEYYTDSTDKFIGFDGYIAIFEDNIFFAYKKCKFYDLNEPEHKVYKLEYKLDYKLEPEYDSENVLDPKIENESNESNQSNLNQTFYMDSY
jgi:hypothetical protein